MKKKIIMVSSIAVIIAIIVIGITTQDLADLEVPAIQDQKEITKQEQDLEETQIPEDKDTISFDAKQYGDELSLVMELKESPENLEKKSDDALRVGFGWAEGTTEVFPDSGLLVFGPGHLKSYVITKKLEDGEWWVHAAKVDLVPKDYGIDFCMTLKDPFAEFSIDDKTLSVTTNADREPYINAFFIERVWSFELVPESYICHDGQFGGNTFNITESGE